MILWKSSEAVVGRSSAQFSSAVYILCCDELEMKYDSCGGGKDSLCYLRWYPQPVVMLSDYGTVTGFTECQEEVTGGFFLFLVWGVFSKDTQQGLSANRSQNWNVILSRLLWSSFAFIQEVQQGSFEVQQGSGGGFWDAFSFFWYDQLLFRKYFKPWLFLDPTMCCFWYVFLFYTRLSKVRTINLWNCLISKAEFVSLFILTL